MQPQEPIFALRASTPRTLDRGCGGWQVGWPTTRANDSTGPQPPPNRRGGDSLKQTVQTAGWGTPNVRDWKSEAGYQDQRLAESRGKQLNAQALWTGPNPSIGPAETGSGEGCRLGGWVTPAATTAGVSEDIIQRAIDDQRKYGKQKVQVGLARQAAMSVPDMGGWKLNPLFSTCYLMGYPLSWGLCGIRAMVKPKGR